MDLNKSKGNKILKETDKAWMAGFIDGEGCIAIGKQSRHIRPAPTYRAAIRISNTKINSLKFFEKRYGGSILRGDGAYQWRCPQALVKKLICDIKPFLIIKKSQAIVLLKFIEQNEIHARTAIDFKEKYHKLIKELNRNKYKRRTNVIK